MTGRIEAHSGTELIWKDKGTGVQSKSKILKIAGGKTYEVALAVKGLRRLTQNPKHSRYTAIDCGETSGMNIITPQGRTIHLASGEKFDLISLVAYGE